MRIGLRSPDLQQVEPQRKDKAPSATATSQSNAHPEAERVSLQDTTTVQKLVAQALQLPEMREEKVANLRHSVERGEYRPDAKSSAEGLLKKQV